MELEVVMRKISLDTPVYTLIKKYPEIKDIMFSLGFKAIVNPILLKTDGRTMILRMG